MPAGRSAPDVAAALTGTLTGTAVSVGDLRARVDRAWTTWQNSPIRYTDIEPVLPALIADTVRTTRALDGAADPAGHRDALRAAADLYGLLRSYCRRTSRPDLALMSADRAIRAAEDADDPLRIAIARWNLGHALLDHPGSADQAEQVALDAVEQLQLAGDNPELLAAQGALHLVAAVAEAQAGRPQQAHDRLRNPSSQSASSVFSRRSPSERRQAFAVDPVGVASVRPSITLRGGPRQDRKR